MAKIRRKNKVFYFIAFRCLILYHFHCLTLKRLRVFSPTDIWPTDILSTRRLDRQLTGSVDLTLRRPNVGWSNVGQPNVGWPNSRWPNVSRTNFGRTNVVWSNVGQPNVGWPNFGRPNVCKSNVGWSNVTRPNVVRPNVDKPNVNRPNFFRPWDVEPLKQLFKGANDIYFFHHSKIS